jgi:hypothetical protein
MDAGAGRMRRVVRASNSYGSQSEKTLTFGLGTDGRAGPLVVTWPSGARQTFEHLPVGRAVTLVEGESAAP